MITYKQKTIPAQEVTVIDSITCDVCGAQGRDAYGKHGSVNWSKNGSYSHDETCVSMVEGDVWPEGGILETTQWHICSACFRKHILPVLDNLGIKPTVKDVGY